MVRVHLGALLPAWTGLGGSQQGPRPDHQPACPRLRPRYPCACVPSARGWLISCASFHHVTYSSDHPSSPARHIRRWKQALNLGHHCRAERGAHVLLFCTDCLVNTFKEKLRFFFNWNIIVLQRCISFLLYNEVNRLHIRNILSPLPAHPSRSSWSPELRSLCCEQLLTSCLLHTWRCRHGNATLPVGPTHLSPTCPHVLYVCVSIPALEIDSSVPLF